MFLFKTKTKPTGQKNQNLKGNQKSWTSVFSAFIRLFFVLRFLKIKNFLSANSIYIFLMLIVMIQKTWLQEKTYYLALSLVLPEKEIYRFCQCNERRFIFFFLFFLFFCKRKIELQEHLEGTQSRISRCRGLCGRGLAGSTSPTPGHTSSYSGARLGLPGAPARWWNKSRRNTAECDWNLGNKSKQYYLVFLFFTTQLHNIVSCASPNSLKLGRPVTPFSPIMGETTKPVHKIPLLCGRR